MSWNTAASAVYTVLIIPFNRLQYNCNGTLSHNLVWAFYASACINLSVAHVLTCVHMENDFLNIKSYLIDFFLCNFFSGGGWLREDFNGFNYVIF